MLKLNDLRVENLYWIAGFLEGEGTFCRCGGTITVAVSQVNKEPIDNMHKLLGGSLYFVVRKNQNPKWNDYWRWTVYGKNAESLMKAVYPIMSKKIQNKITGLLAWYDSLPGSNFVKSGRKFCRSGLHERNDANVYINNRGHKICKLCFMVSQNKYLAKKRLQLNLN